jgi:acetyl-CoA C-acetyltransferase
MSVTVLGAGTTPFGEHWDRSLDDLAQEAASAALDDAGLQGVATCIAASLFGRPSASALGARALTLVSGDDACGATALLAGINAVRAGESPVMVLGVEKASDHLESALNAMTASLLSEDEAFQGMTLASAYGLMTRAYMERYGLSREELSLVPETAHRNGVTNSQAMLPFEIGDVAHSPLVADPVRVLDSHVAADGAAAIILGSGDQAGGKGRIVAADQGADATSLAQRLDITAMKSTQSAAEEALRGMQQFDVLELDDKFSILPIMAVEDMGLAPRGRGIDFLKKSRLNPSGGVKACGHAFGATGVRQAIDVLRHLEEGRVGLAHAVGGTGANSVITVLSR